jgi:CHASE2 domain-containing sensor protein
MEFKNFDLYIESKLGESYQVKAQSETMGEAAGLFTLPPDCLKIADELKNIEKILEGSDLPMNFGVSLHRCLFHDSIGDMLRVSLGDVLRDDERGMRIRLILSPPEIAALPWEFLYDQRTKCFLSTSGKTPITRYIDLFEPIRSLKITPPVKVLVLIPEGSGLDVEKEKGIILEALGDLETAQIRVLEGKVTRSRISRALVEDEYHILHFIGHGVFESDQGYLVINSEKEERDLISADAFADFFRTYPSLKLIVLNSCQGAETSSSIQLAGLAPQLVVRGIPAVVAMQYPISDDAALTFAKEFYLKLCKGANRGQVDMAISHARNRIHMDIKEPLAFATPVLFMRSPTGIIFDIDQHTGFAYRFLRLFNSSAVKNVNRLKAVKQTHETNIAAWEEKTKEAAPEMVQEATAAIAREKQEISVVDDQIIKWNKTFLASLLATLIVFLLGYVGLFNFPFHVDDWLETKFIPYMDQYVTKRFSPDVRLILADEGDNGGLGEPGPSWRQYHGPLIDALTKARTKVIVFDLEVNDPNPAYDDQFAEAIKRAEAQGTYVILAKALDEEGNTIKDIAEKLSLAVKDRWGNIDVGKTRGGLVRAYQLAQPVRNSSSVEQATEVAVIPSLGLQAIARFLSRGPTVKSFFNEGPEQVQLRSDGELIKSIPVYENSQSLYDFPYDLVTRARLNDATRPYRDVFFRRGEDEYLREYAGKIVLVGFKTHQDSWLLQGEQRYGTEIHANVISNILSNVYIQLLPSSFDFLIVAFMAGFGALVQARFRHVFSTSFTFPLPEHKKKLDIPGLLFAVDVVYLLIAFQLYKNERLFILKSYHLAAPFIAYWLTGKMRRRATLRPG